MKKILYSILAIAAVFSSAACSKEESANDAIEFTGITALTDTRTELSPADGGYNLNWIQGDMIAVVGPDGEILPYIAKTGGSPVTTFRPYDPSRNFTPEDMDVDDLGSLNFPTRAPETGEYTAYYPASIVDGTLPSVQKYVEGNVNIVPMVAVNSSDPTTFNFNQIGGIMKLCISTSESGVRVRSIGLSANQGLSGAYTLENSEAMVDGTDGVTLDCGEDGVAIGSSAVPFHICVPVNSYSGLVIRIATTDGRMSVIRLKENTVYTVRRAELREINLTANNFGTGSWTDKKAILMQGVDFNETLKRMAGTIIQQADADNHIKKVIFKTGDNTIGQKRMDDPRSEVPIYADYDENSGVITIKTAADVIYTGESAAAMFENMTALEEVENIAALNTSATNNFYRLFYLCKSMKSIDVSTFSTENVTDARSMFRGAVSCEKVDLSSFDVTRLATPFSLDYMFFNMPKLKEIRFGAKGEHTGSFRPSYFFCSTGDTFADRTGSYYKSLTIYCTETAASWLADTGLRWIRSGYSGKTKITVTFKDYQNSTTVYSPTWASN